jgi:hypothetical protein
MIFRTMKKVVAEVVVATEKRNLNHVKKIICQQKMNSLKKKKKMTIN